MATVACPGCGLPRAEAEVGARPCPVCDAAPTLGARRAGRMDAPPDHTAGLPADASELHAPAPHPAGGRSRALPAGAAAFLLGALCGAAGVLGVQATNRPEPESPGPEVAALPALDPLSPPAGPALAPMPHEGGVKPIAPIESEPDDDFALPEPPPPPGVVVTHTINMPNNTYVVPTMKKGEHIVLKGKVRALRVYILDAGAALDASELDAAVITVTGKIDNRSTLKLKAPKGAVQFSGRVDGGSAVEVNAPEGEVTFFASGKREGARIDNGSRVAVTARAVEFKGAIAGAGTKVSVTLTRSPFLKFASLGDKAVLEYRAPRDGLSPDVVVGAIDPTATFRRAGE